ncbi:MAG: 2,3-bisphosphoglycerate-independent phosphoglycerate mutase [bacterium]|nr:2,3-bisphosphoglycerate-independent phosphoglycerate mutase [bacterium]
MSGTIPRPLVLCILDGWGLAEAGPGNAISQAATPTWMTIAGSHAMTTLATSGEAVGLPCGQMGNSEVGHLTMGAGRIVMQNLPRIDAAVRDGSLAGNPVLGDLIGALKRSRGVCHIAGLLSPGGVHSHQDHVSALANILHDHGIDVVVHAFLDGRDTPPSSAQSFLERFAGAAPRARIVTLTGRYYAMDRDRRWQRVKLAWAAMVKGEGARFGTTGEAMASARTAALTDEFVKPAVIGAYAGMNDGDGLIMANFRADRARQITGSLVDPAFAGFDRDRKPQLAGCAGMVPYAAHLDRHLPALFPSLETRRSFGSLISDAGMRQLRIAETEKYAHVTYFFNGGREHVFPGEERILVPSPDVATYDLKPEMAAFEVTERLVSAVRDNTFDVIICNLANPDMVGHTGVLPAAVKAVEAVDRCLAAMAHAVADMGGRLVVTADHGNIETMLDPVNGGPHTAHTTNPVPLALVHGPPDRRLREGSLQDLAPTMLHLLDLAQPDEMSGQSLLSPHP